MQIGKKERKKKIRKEKGTKRKWGKRGKVKGEEEGKKRKDDED